MHDRSALGPADVTDDELALMVADLLCADPADTVVLDSVAEVCPYDLPAITTAGRYWVSGTAEVAGTARPFRMFVKHIQAWSRSPLFGSIPPEHQAMAEASVPWRTEALAYRSDLGSRLPRGLTMPRALGVFDIDDKSAVIWLEEVAALDGPWDLSTYVEAAGLLGRLAASPAVAERRDVGRHDFDIRMYAGGRLSVQVLPMLRDDGIWQHPLVAGAFDDETRARLLEVCDRVPALVDEVLALPHTTSHGDACPNNLLRSPDLEGFVLIDYGFWGREPVGFDLSQLLVGDVQVGRRDADDLVEVDAAILRAYLRGMRAEGSDAREDEVRRGHAVLLMLFTGLSCLPFEHLASPLTPQLQHVAAQRAAIARFSLDLLDETA